MDGIWIEYGWNMMEYGWSMDRIWIEYGWNMDGNTIGRWLTYHYPSVIITFEKRIVH